MIRKEIKDYVPEITQEVNEYYKKMNLDISFKEKEVEKLLIIVMNNISTSIKREKDVHITGFFRLFFSKNQMGRRLWYKNGQRRFYYQPTWKEMEAEFFANN